MNKHHAGDAAARTFGRAVRNTFLVGVILAPMTSGSAAPNVVPAEFQGTWARSKASCESALRVRIAGDRLTLENGKDSESFGGIEMAGPGYFPPDYRGTMAVLLTEFSGNQPVMVTFNLGEKKGVAQLEFAPVMPGKATAQLAAYNAQMSKLNLAKRFPLDKAPPNRCAGAPVAK